MRSLTVVTLVIGMAAAPAMAQSVGGQQNNQPSANQNQPQMQTDNNQQPPAAKTLPPSADAQAQPNPLPQLAR